MNRRSHIDHDPAGLSQEVQTSDALPPSDQTNRSTGGRPTEQTNTSTGGSPSSDIKGSILVRVTWLYGAFTALAIFIIVKAITIQVGSSGEELRAKGVQYSFRSERLEAARGDILSDDDRILSTSIPLYELRLDLGAQGLTDTLFEQSICGLATSLSSFFGDASAADYEQNLRQARKERRRYHPIAPRKVNYVELQQIRDFPLFREGVRKGGFITEPTFRRVKPLGDVAVRTIGFVNSNGIKLGIEGGFDDVLRGVEGLTIKQKISGNFWIPISSPLNIEPINGMDVRTTINIEMQDIVQTALRERIVEVEADWGTVVVMEVATGQIKAIANITRTREGKLVEDYNYAVGMSQEPGSTFKLAGLLALVDDAKLPISTIINTEGGEVMIGQAKVVDTRSGGYGPIPLSQVFEVSSNIGMAKAVNRCYGDNPGRFVDRIVAMGLGKELGLQITGEPRPTIKHPKVSGSGWDGTSLTMMSYGYALRLTPLQTLAFYNAVANDGKMMRPQLVTALIEKGKVVREIEPEVIIEQIASPEAIRTVQGALRGVVERGTARSLGNPRYTVAAKTGTAQIAMGRRGYTAADGSRHYLGSIAGYFPAENPKYSMIIAFKTYYKSGSGKTYYGGALSAPLFRTIADRIYSSSYEFLKPAPVTNPLHLPSATAATSVRDSTGTPMVVGMGFNDALRLLEGEGYEVRASGHGKVCSQHFTLDSISGARRISLILN